MKKHTALLLAAVLLLSLCACGKDAAPDAQPQAVPSAAAGSEASPVSGESVSDKPAQSEPVPSGENAVAFAVSCQQPKAGAGTDLLDFEVSQNSAPCEIISSGATLSGTDGSASALTQPFLFAGETYTAFVSFRAASDFDPAGAEVRLPEGFTLVDFGAFEGAWRIRMEFTVPASALNIVLNEPYAGDNALNARAEASLDGVPCRVTDLTWRERESGAPDWTSRLNLFCRGYDYTARISIVPQGGVIPCITSDVMGILNSYPDKKMFGIDVSSNFGEVVDCAINSTEAGYYYIVYIEFSLDGSTPVHSHEHQPVADDMDSTCVTAGYHRTCCRVCGEELSREDLPLAEHTWTVTTRDGKEIRVCGVCGAVNDEALN